jgi:cytochrome c oxidase subunit 2
MATWRQEDAVMPPAASANAARVDALFLSLLGLCGVVALAVCVLVIVFCVRYRRGTAADRSYVPRQLQVVEVIWTVVPLLLFVGLCAAASVDYLRQNRAPDGAMPVFVVAKQWMWTLQHGNGRREINEMHVPLGRPVRLLMTSQDVIHSFFVPAFRLKQDVVPGRYTALTFTAIREGTFDLYCAEYCATGHSVMRGKVVVLAPAQFAAWLSAGGAPGTLALQGAHLFRLHGCSGCHSGSSRAPRLEGLFGSSVALEGGGAVVADENYIRDSIMRPHKDLVAGYADVMPDYSGQLSEQDLLALLEYLRGLR